MADTSTTVALNIGSQRISMAVFELSKSGGLILKAYDSESIAADPALDASRIAQTRVAVGDLAQRLKVGKTRARYAISGQAVFTRFVKLPRCRRTTSSNWSPSRPSNTSRFPWTRWSGTTN